MASGEDWPLAIALYLALSAAGVPDAARRLLLTQELRAELVPQ